MGRVGSAFGLSLLAVIDIVLQTIIWFVFVWVILSWALLIMSNTSFRWKNRKAFNVFVIINQFFEAATRPILRPFRRLLPPHKTAGIDWSPMLLLLAIYFIRTFLHLAF